jgi:hypothetical protein
MTGVAERHCPEGGCGRDLKTDQAPPTTREA